MFLDVPMSTLAFLVAVLPMSAQQQTPLAGSAIPQFIDPLPTLSAAGGSIATVVADVSDIEMHMREFRATMLPSTFVPAKGTYAGTWVWGYTVGPGAPASPVATFTGPVVVATRGMPTQFRFVNDLGWGGTTNVVAWRNATDQTLHWADPLGGGMNTCQETLLAGMPPSLGCLMHYEGPIPGVVHLHGGDVPPVVDGGPDAWFTSDGTAHGPAYYTRPGVAVAGNEAVYRYPNQQEAAPTWFHDHALGITRLNVYAGLAGAYVIIDPTLQLPIGLHPLGLQQGRAGTVDYVIPLVIQDRMFDVDGQLYYPNFGDNPEHPYWVPEFIGDTITVNGEVWPYLDVEPRRYRFLIINGSSARAYELFVAPGDATSRDGPSMWQIGTDGGYLDAPVSIAGLRKGRLALMPGERADVIIDFAGFAGQTLLLRNTGRTPYPFGEAPDGATVGRIMQFRVHGGAAVDQSYDPAGGIPIRTGAQQIVRLADPSNGTVAAGVVVAKTRQLTLNEIEGVSGPFEALLNNTSWDGSARPDFTAITVGSHTAYYSELPNEGETEVWEIVNLTADAHPIHTHLTQVQVLNRQRIRLSQYMNAYEAAFPGGDFIPGFGPPLDYDTGNARALGGNPDVVPFLLGPAKPPAANEAGWKDTVQMFPGEVTRIVVRYAPQHLPVGAQSLAYPFDPNALGRGYVWHCHILEHEDNEMMRPYAVIPQPGAIRTFVQGIDY